VEIAHALYSNLSTTRLETTVLPVKSSAPSVQVRPTVWNAISRMRILSGAPVRVTRVIIWMGQLVNNVWQLVPIAIQVRLAQVVIRVNTLF
jgi:hypothetical protein